jgi:hypothetical protein
MQRFLGTGGAIRQPKPWRSCACQRTTRRWEIARIAQLRRAETPWSWEVAITRRMACLVSAGSQVSAIGPTNPHSFFFAGSPARPPGRPGRVPSPAARLLSFSYDSVLTTSTLRPGLAPSRSRGAFPDLLADAGQVGREHAFPAQDLAHRLFGTLGLQVNLELLLGAQIPPLLLLAGGC